MLYPLNGYGVSLQTEALAVTGPRFRLPAMTIVDLLEAGEISPRDVLLDLQSRIETVSPRTGHGRSAELQLVGAPCREADLLAIAAWCEAVLGASLAAPIDRREPV